MYFHFITIVGWLVSFTVYQPFFESFNAKLNLIQFSISIVFLYTHLNVKTVLFQAIQFSISTQFSSI